MKALFWLGSLSLACLLVCPQVAIARTAKRPAPPMPTLPSLPAWHWGEQPAVQFVPADGSASLGAGATATAEPARATRDLSLQEAVEACLAYYPRVASDRAAAAASRSTAKAQASDLWPVVRANAEYDPYSMLSNGRMASIEATQLLFDGFSTSNRIDAAVAESAAAQWEMRVNAQAVANVAVRAFTGMQRERALMVAAQRNLSEHRHALDQIDKVVKADSGKEFDRQQIRARVAFAASIVDEREGPFDTVSAQFEETVGCKPGALLPLGQAPTGAGFGSLEEALALALKVNPQILVARNRHSRRVHERQQAEADLLPRLDLDGTLLKAENWNDITGPYDEATVSVRASYSFPTGGGVFAQVNTAKKLEESATALEAAAERDTRENVRVAWAQRASLAKTIDHAQQHMTLASGVLAGYRAQYALGRRTILDLLIVQNEAFQAEARLIGLRYDLLAADYNLATQIGVLDRFVALPKPDDGP